MNLAPIKYAQASSHAGGPIEKIEESKTRILGTTQYLVNSWLSSNLNLNQEQNEIFSPAAGSGTDTSAMVARHKAISEALERWAFHYLMQIDHTRTYGFDLEPSTTGMAAFPGLFHFQSRRLAKLEAIERFCVHHWWHRQLGHEILDTQYGSTIRLENPITKDPVVLSWNTYGEQEITAYGSAADKNLDKAIESAQLEMELSARALTLFLKQNRTFSHNEVRNIDNYSERQILCYALPEGKSVFRTRLRDTSPCWTGDRPTPIIDCLIPGPWQKYATVWRVLYPMENDPNNRSLSANFLY